MSKYTKGPWSVENETDIIGIENDPENDCIGQVDIAHVYLRTVQGRTEANARLIAAAPDMLCALKKAEDAMTFELGGEPCGLHDALIAVRAAIAKATGDEE